MKPYTPAASRYETSPTWFRPCGQSGLKLPAISLGMWHNFGAPGSDAAGHRTETDAHEAARQLCFTAFDHGITHFDLANNYGPPPGSAEKRIGRILAELPRNELVISTKAGFRMWPGPYGDAGSRKYLLQSLEESLTRLRLSHVDIFYHHRPDFDTPLEETLGALDTAVRQGKAIYAGISNYPGQRTDDAAQIIEDSGMTRLLIHQQSYAMFNRGPEHDLFPVIQRHGMGVIAFCPLAQGLLTGKYLNGIPKDSRVHAKGGFLRPKHVTEQRISQARKLDELAKQRNQSLAQMALAWVLRRDEVTSALIGASRPSQIIENVKVLDQARFTQSELDMIDEILETETA